MPRLLPLLTGERTFTQVNVQTRVTLQLNPGLVRRLGSVTRTMLDTVYGLLLSGKRGSVMSTELQKLQPLERDLFNAFRSTANRVPGSAQSMLTLRSSLGGYYDTMQTFTMNLNLNPGDLQAHTIFSMAGGDKASNPTYTFDDQGKPLHRPTATRCWEVIAKNPVACALYFTRVLEAFIQEFLGWDRGAATQARPDW